MGANAGVFVIAQLYEKKAISESEQTPVGIGIVQVLSRQNKTFPAKTTTLGAVIVVLYVSDQTPFGAGMVHTLGVHMSVSICMHAYICVHINRMCVFMYMYTYMCVHMTACVCPYTCTHTCVYMSCMVVGIKECA